MIRIMANFSFNSSRAPIYSEELLRRAEDDLIALNELEAFNSSFYTELNASVDSVILAVEAFTKVGNHAIRKKNECGIVDFLYGSMAEVAKESEGSLLDAVTIIINRVNDSHKDKKRFIQEAKNDIYRNLQHELDGTGVVVSETLYPNLCAFLTEYPKELEKRKEAEEAKAIEQAKRGVPCVGHVCSDKSISVSKKMPAIQFFNEDAPEAKMTAKKEAPKANNGSEEFHIVFLDEDGVEYEVPEDDILELLAFMEMLDEEDDEF